jgi:hypothetical protein
MLERDDDLRDWLPRWKSDGGDARHFRRAIAARYGRDEVRPWRHSEQILTPLRLQIREVARALLVHPRPLRYDVVAAIAAIREPRPGEPRPGQAGPREPALREPGPGKRALREPR